LISSFWYQWRRWNSTVFTVTNSSCAISRLVVPLACPLEILGRASACRGLETPRKGTTPMADRPVFLYAAVYDEIDNAKADYEAVFDLHAAGVIETFDSAVIEKHDDKVRVHKTEKPTQHGAWTGIAVGAIAGVLFPPSIIGGAVVAGGAGGVIGHLWRGMSRGDLKELGEALDDGDAILIVIGESTIDEQIEKATQRAVKVLAKELDADPDELKREIEQAEREGTPT
jgi:uncharacterized membrane protein